MSKITLIRRDCVDGRDPTRSTAVDATSTSLTMANPG
jgi:hypothetical protein